MDNLKNIIAAISLSAAVIVIYAIFFQKPMPQDPKNILIGVLIKSFMIDGSFHNKMIHRFKK